MPTIFFDFDGTLHDTMRIYGPAFRVGYQGLVDKGLASSRGFDDEWISRWLGWTIKDMWTTFMPELSEEQWRNASHEIGQEMYRLMDAGVASLYDGVPKMLDELVDKGFVLVLLSNAQHSYCDKQRACFGLDRWFSDYCISEDYPGMEKWEFYKKVRDKYPYPHVVVGDRFHDMEVAARSEIPSIGCSYGFGRAEELEEATAIASQPSDIPRIIERLIKE